jgi:NADPH2:quinone reductase
MKAVVCKQYGPPEALAFEEMPAPALGPGQVRIGVRAAGVNFPDLLIIKGEYQFKPPPPFVPGAEVAGDVLELGEGASGVSVGDRVIAMTVWNGFAEQVVVPAEACLPMPARMGYDVGAGFAMAYGTSYHALVQRGHVRAGETLLVLGAAGGVGSAAVEIGQLLGARVIAAGGSDDKLAALRAATGVADTINYAAGPLKERVRELTGGRGADVIYDPVGGDLFEQCLRAINWEGRLLVVGFASGTIPQARANLILLKGCAVVGVFWGAFATRDPAANRANFAELFRWYDQGRLKPQPPQLFPLERASEALAAIAARKVVGKAVLTIAGAAEARP